MKEQVTSSISISASPIASEVPQMMQNPFTLAPQVKQQFDVPQSPRILVVSKSPIAGALSLDLQRNSTSRQSVATGHNGKLKKRFVLAKKLSQHLQLQEQLADKPGVLRAGSQQLIAPLNFQQQTRQTRSKHFSEFVASSQTSIAGLTPHGAAMNDLVTPQHAIQSAGAVLAQNLALKMVERVRNRFDSMDENEKIKRNNIFTTPQHQTGKLSERFVEFAGGPRFKDGKVVSYSVVGPPQLFAKYLTNPDGNRTSIKESQQVIVVGRQPKHRASRIINDISQGGNNISQEIGVQQYGQQQQQSQQQQQQTMNSNTPPVSRHSNKSSSLSGIGFADSRSNFMSNKSKNIPLSRHDLLNGSQAGIWFPSKKKYSNNDFSEYTKEELLNEMANAKQRILAESILQKNTLNDLTVEQRNHVTRDERVIKKFQKTIDQWSQEVEQLGQANHRKPEDSLIVKSEEFRKKKELAEGYETLSLEQSIMGPRAWYSSLRKNNISPDNKLFESHISDANQDIFLSRTNIRVNENGFQHHDQSRVRDPQIFDPKEQVVTDILHNFNTLSIHNQYKQIEVVRKPTSLLQKTQTSKNMSSSARNFNTNQHNNPSHKSTSCSTTRPNSSYRNSSSFKNIRRHNISSPINLTTNGGNISNRNFMESQNGFGTNNHTLLNTSSFFQAHVAANQLLLKDKIVLPNEEDINDLIIEGHSVYDKELDSLISDGLPNTQKYNKLDFLKAALSQIPKSTERDTYQYGQNASKARSISELDDNKTIYKYYVPSELTKTGRYFYKNL